MSYRLPWLPCYALVLGLAGVLLAQEPSIPPPAKKLVSEADSEASPAKENPFHGPEDVQQGRQLIRAHCSRCHGIDGKGGKGPDLTDGVFRHGSSDEDIKRNIETGIVGTGMPSFGEEFDKWTWQMISYLRAEADKRSQDDQKVLMGNAEHGRELFLAHKCGSCHWTGSRGGRRGTDLTRSRAAADYVRQAIADPDAQIDGTYQPVVMVMKSGTVREGMRLFENSYYLLIMDDKKATKHGKVIHGRWAVHLPG